jgi:hypothetical protein
MAQELFQRRAVRQKLAELLREPLERVDNETHLRKLGRYDIAVGRELLKVFGLELSDDRLRALERVKDLLEAAESAGRSRAALKPNSTGEANPAASRIDALPVTPPPAPPGTFESTLAYDPARIHAAAVYCSDGRVGEQMDEFLHQGLGLPRYDRVACPGGPVALAGRLLAFWECRSVEEQLRFLVRAHGLGKVVLIAHQDCAYYRERLAIPAMELEAQQVRDLDMARASVARLADGLEISTFYARRTGDHVRFERR